MSYAAVPGDQLQRQLASQSRGPRPDSLRLAFGLAGGLAVVVSGAVVLLLLFSNRGSVPTPRPFQFSANGTIVNAVYTQVETALPPFEESSSSTGQSFGISASSLSSLAGTEESSSSGSA